MKKYFLFIAVIFILVSCQEDVTFNNPSIQGMKENVFWRAVQSKATLAPDGSLVIEAYTRNEILSLKVTSTKAQGYVLGTSESKKAVYVVTDAAGAITTFSTGNGIGDGQIIITEYDDINKTVTGTFRFNAKNTNNNSLAGPILNFQNGVFYKVPVNSNVP
ncbi:DUF6252 family protein [Flavobacterium caseinilyticum]|uniref:Uncharacterized protein n=1 Tax=Flavobacterium caseinilyticum TaxID=2541732 RepID=A0A4R5AYU1_9FLAO|nr:DUF6252 family protein [Flavobacterium caseinilyticum]TDD76414.1 hypothetical protein E0F89_09340 [Flavobacterium caseinilyticum]